MTDPVRQHILELLAPGRRFVLTTHVQPDGDGLGSEIAFAQLVAGCGGEARIINADRIPRILEPLGQAASVELYDASIHDAVIAAADAVIMLDSSVTTRLGPLLEPIQASSALRVCIDHHPEPDDFWNLSLVDTSASSTGELVYELFLQRGVGIAPTAAQALYVALVSDTGRFRFRNTSPRALRMAADLVEAGASPSASFAMLEEQHTEGFLRLYGRILASMEVRSEGRVVVLRVPRALVAEHGAENDDFSDIINRSLASAASRVAVLVRERPDGRTKVSLRSKGTLDVNRLARVHGGGGHPNASGIVIDADLEATLAQLLPDVEALAQSD